MQLPGIHDDESSDGDLWHSEWKNPHGGSALWDLTTTGQTTLGASQEKSLLPFKGRWVPPAWVAQHGFGTPVDKEEMPLEF